MAIIVSEVVDIPSHSVRIKNGKYEYIYFIQKTYRDKNGQVRNDRVCIGKPSDQAGKMVPNKNYYKVFSKTEPTHLPDMIRSCGSFAVCRQLSAELSLTDHLKKAFPSIYEEILTIAHYMLVNGSVMYYLNDWLDGCVSFTADPLDGASIGRVFSEVQEKDKNMFFQSWMKEKGKNEFIAYDVTSVSSYSETLEDVEFGYNRDKERLPQINIGMYCCEESRLPVYYRVYPGSIVDKVHLSSMIEGTDALNIKRVFFVMDKGFYTELNLKYITDQGHRFMITMLPTLTKYRELIDENCADIVDNIDYKMPNELMYCKKVEVNFYGFRMNAHIYYNQQKASDSATAFYEKLKSMEKDLTKMEVLPPKGSSYYDYFTISNEQGEIHFEKRKEEIKKALSRCGFFIILETVFQKTSEEVLSVYRNRDTIEKCFDDLKNELDLDRVRCSKEETTSGKMFAAFVSLILLSQLRKKLGRFCFERRLTMKKILLELDKIKIAYDLNKPKQYRMMNPITKLQRDILETLEMTEDIFHKLV